MTVSNQPRQPAGNPQGGQFAANPGGGESDIRFGVVDEQQAMAALLQVRQLAEGVAKAETVVSYREKTLDLVGSYIVGEDPDLDVEVRTRLTADVRDAQATYDAKFTQMCQAAQAFMDVFGGMGEDDEASLMMAVQLGGSMRVASQFARKMGWRAG